MDESRLLKDSCMERALSGMALLFFRVGKQRVFQTGSVPLNISCEYFLTQAHDLLIFDITKSEYPKKENPVPK